MGKNEKRIAKMRQNPKNVRYNDIENLLIGLGYSHTKRGTSHNVFKLRREGKETLVLVVPYKRPFVKQIYVKDLLAQLETNGLIS